MYSWRLGFMALAAVCLLGITAAPGADVPAVAAKMPAGTEAFIQVDLRSFESPESLLNMIPRADVEARIAEAMKKTGMARSKPASGSGEVAVRLAFDGEISAVFDSISVAVINSADLQSQDDFAILTGNFTPDEMMPALEPYQLAPGPSEGIVLFPSARADSIYLRCPDNGVLLISNSLDWIQGGAGGFGGAGSAYARAASGVGPVPDATFYLSGGLFTKASAGDPMANAFLGPFAKLEGAAFFLLPGGAPAVELRSIFPDEQSADLGRQYLEQMLIIFRSQVEAAAQRQKTIASFREAKRTLELLDKIELKTEGRQVVGRAVLDNLPTREEFRERFLEGLESSLAEGFSMSGGYFEN